MRFILSFLFCISVVYGQLNVKNFGAVGDGVHDDYPAIQAALDSGVKIMGDVYAPRGKYRITKPLMIYSWSNGAYVACTVKFYGDDNMWSGGTMISVIKPDFKDGFALGVQRGKGVIVDGISFQGKYVPPSITMDSMYRTKLSDYGDTSVRRDRYSPYAAIVVDPFSGIAPIGGGYPSMNTWYRGAQTRSGSTGCRFTDMTFLGFDVGAVTSPNGFTQNAEIMTFENIRITNCRIGIAGSQAQEKLNRIINLGAWGATHTLFTWGLHGVGHPGHWVIDGVNIAGQVNNLLYRGSGSWFPLHVSNVFAESLGGIGYWYSSLGDELSNSVIDFVYPDQVKAFHNSFNQMVGVTFSNCNLRYYGELTRPIVFGSASFDVRLSNNFTYVPMVWGKLPMLADSVDMGTYKLLRGGFSPQYFRDGSNIKAYIPMKRYANMAVGDMVIIVNSGNWTIMGMCKVSEVGTSDFTVDYISSLMNQSTPCQFYIYKKK